MGDGPDPWTGVLDIRCFPGEMEWRISSVYSLRDNLRAKQRGDEDDGKLGKSAGHSSGRMHIKNFA
jgi:hypothetical protein